MNHTDTLRTARFQSSMTANALERIAYALDRLAAEAKGRNAGVIDEAVSELLHHADALREATGLNAMTEANLHALLSNPRTID